MNKTVGATLGVALLAGLIFQTRTSVAPRTEQQTASAIAASAAAPVSDGPWIASCNYWSAVQPVSSSPMSGPPASNVTIAQTAGVKLQLQPSTGTPSCGPDAWGMPTSGPFAAQISAVIATVPDPIHSHLALDFDRSIDAMLLAAADNHYLGSYYWLPWRSQTGAPGEPSSAAKPNSADSIRERQPGLIILRYTAEAHEWNPEDAAERSSRDYRRVIYLFLVAETPALGINGNQLQNAFHYEQLLENQGARLSVSDWFPIPRPASDRSTPQSQHHIADGIHHQRDRRVSSPEQKHPCPNPNDELSIIGPLYSGSAASLHAGIEAALPGLCVSRVSITGVTGTAIAVRELDPGDMGIYRSFGENISFEQDRFLQSLAATGYDLSRVAVLSEAGTVFGGAANFASAANPPTTFRKSDADLGRKGTILYLRFPRELSLLRNAEATQPAGQSSTSTPTPYLNLSLKDYSADDTVPRFSTVQSPLSIEAQLMAIAHQLQRARSQFILISASNVLDDLFLAQFLHRACPDARLVILSGGDLLFERDTDNAPYIGSISISPYLLSSLDFGNRVQWLHADYEAEEVYNAASFTFRSGNSAFPPTLAGYRSYPVADRIVTPDGLLPPVQFQQIPLWATVIGDDGYYPLAVLSWCASDHPEILPTISFNSGRPQTGLCTEEKTSIPDEGAPAQQPVWKYIPESINENSGILPSLSWGILVGFILFACIGHCIFLISADFWSPFTRDLAIDHNDLPHRRAIHVNIGTSVLTALAFVIAYPLLRVGHYFHLAPGGYPLALLLLVCAALAIVCTVIKTWRYRSSSRQPLYGFFNFVAAAALVGIVTLWIVICGSDIHNGYYTYAGLYFCFRCLRPLNGVCPLLPIILLLFAWYLWSIYQTARLRFSDIHRPRLARRPSSPPPYSPSRNAYDLFVPDNTLESCARSSDNCLYANITCLLISREVIRRLCVKIHAGTDKRVRRIASWVYHHINTALFIIYVILFCLCMFASKTRALDHFLFQPLPYSGGPTLYEFLVAALFFPLIMVVFSGWLRVILIWGSLSRGLLEPLERMPIRFAFTRFNGGGWFSMLRQKGLHIRWRDMARSTESIRQLIHHDELAKQPGLQAKLVAQFEIINTRIYQLMNSIKACRAVRPPLQAELPGLPDGPRNDALAAAAQRAGQYEHACPSRCRWDLPADSTELCNIFHIEEGYARFCTILIEDFLASHWDKDRTGLVEDNCLEKEKTDKSKEQEPASPSLMQLAEELIVIRYVALIRAVLINIRYLMLFVSTAFVLALIGWNSYPFEPHAFIDWCFTLLLASLTLGFVSVFAQMHRNAILSRITNTTANELGWEFYLRLITFGAVPVLTWLAYQFPSIGGSLYRIIQPGLQVVK